MRKNKSQSKSGQTLVFFVMLTVILVFVVLWNYDLHKIIHTKSLTRNAGDAASLTAARWQGISLNIIGELNILEAIALSNYDTNAVIAITNMMTRVAFVGPMIAFQESQQAAKNNRMHVNHDFTDYTREHAVKVKEVYPYAVNNADGTQLFPEPYENAWDDYSAMIDLVADGGIAAGPDNSRFFTDRYSSHYLLRIDFYEAVAGRTWCWFHRSASGLLESYGSFNYWPDLPELRDGPYINSEFFSLGLSRFTTTLESFYDIAGEANVTFDATLPSDTNDIFATWYIYNPYRWSSWSALANTKGAADADGSGSDFPIVGQPMGRYNYSGADACVRIVATTKRVTPGENYKSVSNNITWTSAAKPFGYLNETNQPNNFGIVFPAFREVALIPIDASSMPSGGSYNIPWRKHIENHLDGEYMLNGPTDKFDCMYCQILTVWEDDDFRDAGIEWLATNSWMCTIGPAGGPGGSSGGTRTGH